MQFVRQVVQLHFPLIQFCLSLPGRFLLGSEDFVNHELVGVSNPSDGLFALLDCGQEFGAIVSVPLELGRVGRHH